MRLRDILLATVTAGSIFSPLNTHTPAASEIINEYRLMEYKITNIKSKSRDEIWIENTIPMDYPYKVRAVLDYGKGTGTLAIQPEKGSPWCYESANSPNQCPQDVLQNAKGLLVFLTIAANKQ